MNKAELVGILARRKSEADLAKVVWADVVAAVQAMDTGQKDAIVAAVRERRVDVGRLIITAVVALVESRAQSAVQNALAVDNLTMAELAALIP